MFCIYNISIFLNPNSRIFENSLKKYTIRIIKLHKTVSNCLTSLIRWNRKKRRQKS